MTVTNETSVAQTSGAGATSSTSKTDALANKEVFLQMLVAQIKNQDPLNPTDGAQFMTQLAQFSQLEQLIGIRQELSSVTTDPNTVTPPSTDPGATSPATTTAAAAAAARTLSI